MISASSGRSENTRDPQEGASDRGFLAARRPLAQRRGSGGIGLVDRAVLLQMPDLRHGSISFRDRTDEHDRRSPGHGVAETEGDGPEATGLSETGAEMDAIQDLAGSFALFCMQV